MLRKNGGYTPSDLVGKVVGKLVLVKAGENFVV